jgi:hypothetical protein
VLVARYVFNPEDDEDEGMACEMLAQHVSPPGFVLPINLMITDAQGEAARVVIQQPERWRFADLN